MTAHCLPVVAKSVAWTVAGALPWAWALPAQAQNVTPVTCLVQGTDGKDGINTDGISVTKDGTLATTSTNATLFVQSLGANGTSNTAHGGAAGDVTVTTNGTVYSPGVFTPGTQGFGGLIIPQSAAIWAQSIGGCGYADKSGAGKGGEAGNVSVTVSETSVIQLGPNVAGVYALSAGGQGGGYSKGSNHNTNAGGDAGDVTVVLAGSINNASLPSAGLNTNNSYGIYALSVGGSSGATDNKDSNHGGNAGNVTVSLTSTAAIRMEGENSIAIYAVSAGGLSWYADNGVSHGHQNGDGGDVTVTVAKGATISTNGELGIGILAASTGGNANTSQRPPDSLENGGTTNSVPSDLAPPGNAGNVTVNNAGTITTLGDVSMGIVAVSSTGGRGAGLLTQNADGTYEIDQVGQVGPGTGSPGTVTVDNSGTITTSGIGSSAILALSLGGAGGVMDSKPGLLNLLGGHTAGTGADGNTVEVVDSGTLTTTGAVAMGILAESIGGGGGTATGTSGVIAIGTNGGAGGDGGTVTVKKTRGSITTSGDGAFGILAHSVGGGGGNGGNSTGLVAAVGGAGGASGNGGDVTIDLGSEGRATITTTGDYAPGVGAQSIGGGGGNGGYSKSYSDVTISAAIGGSGGAGGDGGDVKVEVTDALVSTSGSHSAALLLQSISGGGGSGGAAATYTVGVVLAVNTAVGGNGAKSGKAGNVGVSGYGDYVTTGLDSAGVMAQSIGGGGGNGGSALSRTEAIAIPDLPGVSISTAIGGTGGSGGDGGEVEVRSFGHVTTSGDGSVGILAQSIGGGGGNGGDSSAFARAIEAASQSVKVTVSVGGDGKGGGDGEYVAVANVTDETCGTLCRAIIATSGDNATGILAQSIGGGGGNGGAGNSSGSSPNLGADTGTSINVTFTLGGSGGVGGAGGTVDVVNTLNSIISTTGSGAQGILAQSIGGGGGNAGGGSVAGSGDTVVVNIAVGGSGGSGSSGGTIMVNNLGTISTGAVVTEGDGSYVTGNDAVGIMAQSIGGGGGNGGSSDASANIGSIDQIEDLLNSPSNSYTGTVAVGGNGGSGGNGGLTQVYNSGTITTLGVRAYGVLAQSIGGGGGSAGAANSAAGAVWTGPQGDKASTYGITVTVGGTGGSGGNGAEVDVENTGGILTAGYGATGIFAQSIGGGGGVGAEGTVNNTTTIGIGGDWNGAGGSAGNGGVVSVNTGAITTLGDDANGVTAQSIGGGGGAASAGCTNSTEGKASGYSSTQCFGNTSGLTGTFAPWTDSSSLTLVVGGGAGSSGDGGAVTVNVDGAIGTTGARSMGIVAQSIGGGGGFVSASASNIASTTVQGTPGTNNGGSGNVTVSLLSGGSITTLGDGAWGILAQSIAGGGGFAADSSLPIQTLVANTQTNSSKTPSFSAGTVTVNVAGNIITSGANAHGIVAQSVGTGGGIVSTSTGLLMGNSSDIYGVSDGEHQTGGGAITITQTAGTIAATGVGSIGILAQSTGVVTAANAGLPEPITITLDGTVLGGTNVGYSGGIGAAGIVLSGGGNSSTLPSQMNQIQLNAGASLGTMDGVEGVAILARHGWTVVNNAGTITGSIDLGTGTGWITNTGTINAGALVTASFVSNSGTFNVAGVGAIGGTTIHGSSDQAYVQAPTGVLGIDIDTRAAQQVDLLTVDGAAIFYGGEITPYAKALLPGTYTVVTASALEVASLSAPSSLLFNWNVGYAGNSVTLTPQMNLQPAGVALNASEASLARYLTRAWNASDSLFAPTFGYLSQIGGSAGYKATLGALSTESAQALSSALLNSEGTLLGSALSCPVFVDEGTLLGEDECVWGKVSGSWTTQSQTSDTQGYSISGATYRIGGQHEIAPNWFLGGSLGAGQSWAEANGGSSGSGQSFDGSISLKHVEGPWLFAGALTLANGTFQNTRVVQLPGIGTTPGVSAVLKSDSSLFMAGARLRGGYEFAFSNWYIRPYVDLDLVYWDSPGYQETGTPGYALNVHGANDTSFIVATMAELGGRIRLDADTLLRPFATFGATFTPDNSRVIAASFVGASITDTFDTTLKSSSVQGLFSAGFDLYKANGFEMKAEYNLTVGDSLLSQGGSARFAYHF